MKKLLALLVLAAFVGSTGVAMAQTAGGTGVKPAHRLSPHKRLKVQRKRIKQGVKNGTIDKQQAQQLHQEGVSINNERKQDLQNDGGKLSSQDRQNLEGQLDQRSQQIYDDKHPGASTGPTGSTGSTGTAGGTTSGSSSTSN